MTTTFIIFVLEVFALNFVVKANVKEKESVCCECILVGMFTYDTSDYKQATGAIQHSLSAAEGAHGTCDADGEASTDRS